MNSQPSAVSCQLSAKGGVQRLGLVYPLLSAVLLWAAFIPDWGFPLAHVALIPLIHALYRGPAPYRSAWIFGGVFGALVCFWLKVFSPLAPLCMSVFFGFWSCVALWPAIAAGGYGTWGHGAADPAAGCRAPFVLFATLMIAGWMCSEWLRSLGPYGFEWARLGYSQYGFDALIRIGGSTATFVATLTVLISNLLLYHALSSPAHFARVFLGLWFIALVILCFTPSPPRGEGGGEGSNQLGSQYGLSSLTYTLLGGEGVRSLHIRSVRLLLLQTHVNPYVSSAERKKRVDEQMCLLADQIADSSADLMILPETLFPHSIQTGGVLDSAARAQLAPLFGPDRPRLLVGAIEYNDSGFFNAAQVFNSDGRLEAQYWKEHLVPFGEAVPVLDRFAPIRRLGKALGTPFFNSGAAQPPPLALASASGDTVRFGVLICFEGTFEQLVRGRAATQPDFMVNISNDAWSESEFGHNHHHRILKFRAVETGLPVVRVGNTRATGVYYANAHVELIPHNSPAALAVTLLFSR